MCGIEPMLLLLSSARQLIYFPVVMVFLCVVWLIAVLADRVNICKHVCVCALETGESLHFMLGRARENE